MGGVQTYGCKLPLNACGNYGRLRGILKKVYEFVILDKLRYLGHTYDKLIC